MNHQLQDLQAKIGLHVHGATDFQSQNMAMDAQSPLVSSANSAVLSMLTTMIDPKLVEVLVAPMKAAVVAGAEVKKGDWTTQTIAFPVIESTGQVASYGDYSTAGVSGVNFAFPQRQAFHYEVLTTWGELELERAGLAKIDYANRLNLSSVLTLNKFQNQTYFFGVTGLQNYGLLNDPALTTPLTPSTKAAGGTTWANGTALENFGDIQTLFAGLQTQAKGLVDLESPMTLAMSPTAQANLAKVTQYNVNVMDMIAKNFPNMKIVTAPEYSTVSGELVQLIADEVEGQRTVECAFTEKLRAHPIIVDVSSWKQKKSQGTWGAVIYRPVFIKQMLGV
jgi:hypothetical protein